MGRLVAPYAQFFEIVEVEGFAAVYEADFVVQFGRHASAAALAWHPLILQLALKGPPERVFVHAFCEPGFALVALACREDIET